MWLIIEPYEMNIKTNSIPSYLKSRKQWLLWKREKRGRNLTKVPYQPNGCHAKTNDSSTWSDFDTCKSALNSGKFDGIGFAFAKGDGLSGIDLDHCFTSDGQLEVWAKDIIDRFEGTYIEKSPSGDGFHIWCFGNPIKTGCKKWKKTGTDLEQGVEIYTHRSARYFTVTDMPVKQASLSERQSALDWLHFKYLAQTMVEPQHAKDSSGQVNINLVREALSYIPADEYSTWIEIGMALKSSGLDISHWEHWSAKSSKYSEGICAEKWSTFCGNRLGLGTLFHHARQNGFRFSAESSRICMRESAQESMVVSLPPWPVLPRAALYGLAGDIVKAATADSEADPAAVLITALVRAGATFGAQCHVNIGETRQPGRLMAAIVGASSRARKGTSTNPITRIFEVAETRHGLTTLHVTNGPLSSGEGLIYAVRDRSEKVDKDGVPEDEGVRDKRLLVIEGELGAPLKAMQREGNTLSAILRTSWDNSGCIAPLTKSNRIKATGAHICIVGHITKSELDGLLQSREVWNGFANRFLWVCARRQGLVAFPQPLSNEVVEEISDRLAHAIRCAQQRTGINLHPESAEIWKANYSRLTRDEGGRFGAVTARAEAQVIRLAMLYALLDCADMILPAHLNAAFGVWDYCRESVRCIFGSSENDPEKNRVIKALRTGEKTQTQLNDLFNGHVAAGSLRSILTDLQALGMVSQRTEGGGRGKGRPSTIWSFSHGFDHLAELEEIEE